MNFVKTMTINLDRPIKQSYVSDPRFSPDGYTGIVVPYIFKGPVSLSITTPFELSNEEKWIVSEQFNMPLDCILFKTEEGS